MLVEGFDSSPMVMMTYNPRYYPELLEKAGLRKSKICWPTSVTPKRSS